MLRIVIIFICGNKALNMAGETINIGHQGRTIKMLSNTVEHSGALLRLSDVKASNKLLL